MAKPPEFDRAVPLVEAAELSGRHPQTLRQAVRQRELPAIRRGRRGHILIRLSALDAWLRRDTIPERRIR